QVVTVSLSRATHVLSAACKMSQVALYAAPTGGATKSDEMRIRAVVMTTLPCAHSNRSHGITTVMVSPLEASVTPKVPCFVNMSNDDRHAAAPSSTWAATASQ